jgi:membrane protein DedA with SNARE-associated domain
MSDIVSLVSRHGYLVVASVVFLEAIGMPMPGALALVAAGAACALGKLSAHVVIAAALLAMVAGDTVLFTLGRFTGWRLLGFLSRVSANPETCILRSAESFYRRGKATLLIAKFIPGINTMAPPLAGSMNMRPWQFVRFDAGGAALYILAYTAAGFLFSGFLEKIIRGFHTASRIMEWVLLVALLAYIVYRVRLYWRHRMYRVVPRETVEEVKRKLEAGEPILLADVRSHGYYDAGAARIQNSIRLEPNHLSGAVKDIPKERQIYLYCT